jgi:hypothetical protein
VCIHAGSWHFDRSCPVEVVVAKVKCQLLNDCFRDDTVIESDVEMSREDTTLSCSLRHQVEIVLTLAVLVLHYLSVNQTT